MSFEDEGLLEELVTESKEHLANVEPDLITLEKGGEVSKETINRIFRAVHSIKGGFSFFGKENIKNLSHVMENVLMKVRDGQMEMSPDTIDALLEGLDKLSLMLDDVPNSDNMDYSAEDKRLSNILKGGSGSSEAENENNVTETMQSMTLEDLDHLKEELSGPIQHGQNIFVLCIHTKKDCADSSKSLDDIYNAIIPIGTILQSSVDLSSEEQRQKAQKEQKKIFIYFGSVLDYDMLTETLPIDNPSLTFFNTSEVKSHFQSSGQNAIKVPETPKPARTESELTKGKIKHAKSQVELNKKQKESTDTIRVKVELLNKIVNLAGELVLGRNQLMQQLKDTDIPGLNAITQNIDIVTSDLQENIMNTRMQPIGNIFGKFHRVVRDIAKKLNKEIEITFYGENVELDKSILEALTDPLTHLVRNCADHGIESPDIREANGKSRAGHIKLSAYHEGGQVNVDINDDGKGIDADAVKEKALEKGLLSEKDFETISDAEAFNLIFEPGFSTAHKVTDVSGRGVGMDVVRTNIEELGGTVDIRSVKNSGTTVTLKLPLTLAIIPSLVIETEGKKYAIPQVSLEQLVRFRAEEASTKIEKIQGQDVFRLRDELVPVVRLNQVLDMTPTFVHPVTKERCPDQRKNLADRRQGQDVSEEILEKRTGEKDRRHSFRSAVNIVVLKVGANRFGLIVERLLDNEEIVVKPLSTYLKNCKSYSGATIMGDGRIALILDPTGIAEEANLKFKELSKEQERIAAEKAGAASGEAQTLLLFKCSDNENLAINLSIIGRVEKVRTSEIEKVGDKEFLKYADSSLRVIRPYEYMPISAPQELPEYVYIIVPKLVKHPIGLITKKVMDVIETEVIIDKKNIKGVGVHGSMIIKDRLITLVDIYSLFEIVEPDIYKANQPDGNIKGLRVLLAEDTAFFRTLEQTYLESLGCRVTTAKNGKQAWELLNSERFDLLLTDIEMPHLNGLELTKMVRESPTLQHMPIIAVTSLTADIQKQKGLDCGVDAYEYKLDKEKMASTIAEVIRSRKQQV